MGNGVWGAAGAMGCMGQESGTGGVKVVMSQCTYEPGSL